MKTLLTWLLACLPGVDAPTPGLAAQVLVAEELDIPWLPPGVGLPLPPAAHRISNQSLPVVGN